MKEAPIYRIRRHSVQWGVVIIFMMSFLSGCGRATPTPIIIAPAPASTPIPPANPTAVLPQPTVIPATATTRPAVTEPTTSAEVTSTLEPSPTLPDPTQRPFLMKIDRISVIVGRGTLLEGRVANGTLQINSNLDILGPQNNVISTTALAILVSNIMRDQVTVGDYASILVGGIEVTDVLPGMLLTEAGQFDSYEEAFQQLQ